MIFIIFIVFVDIFWYEFLDGVFWVGLKIGEMMESLGWSWIEF